MQTLDWKHTLTTVEMPLSPSGSEGKSSLVIPDLAFLVQHLCPACLNQTREDNVEVIADLGAWHLGWRRYACTQCTFKGSRLVLTRDSRNLEYQTHPIC